MNVTSCVKEGIIKAINPIGGVSKTTGNAWTKTNVVLDFSSPNKVRQLEIPFWGEGADMIAQSYKVGDRVRIAFDVEGREYNGRLYPELRGFAVEHVGDGGVETPANKVPANQMIYGGVETPAKEVGSAAVETAANKEEEGIPF